MDGTELAMIKQDKRTVVSLKPKFQVTRDGQDWAEMAKGGAIEWKKELLLDIPGNNNYKIKGDVPAWNFQIFRTETEEKCAEVNKKWGVRDNYGVKIEDGEDTVA